MPRLQSKNQNVSADVLLGSFILLFCFVFFFVCVRVCVCNQGNSHKFGHYACSLFPASSEEPGAQATFPWAVTA